MNERPKIRRIEMKFRLDAALSEQVKDWARHYLGVDENCGTESGDTYDLNTLYLDTPELDLFHRSGVVGPAKHRIRRYGNEQTLWLETKRKKNMVVRKNRTAVFESDWKSRLLSLNQRLGDRSAPPSLVSQQANESVTEVDSSDDVWCGDWFIDRIQSRRFQPAIQIAYRRFARTSLIDGENLRLTIDSDMHASHVEGWSVRKAANVQSQNERAFGDFEVLELKFHNQLPHLFKELLRTFTIPSTGFSKYRTAMASLHNTDLPARSMGTNGQAAGASNPGWLNHA